MDDIYNIDLITSKSDKNIIKISEKNGETIIDLPLYELLELSIYTVENKTSPYSKLIIKFI